MLPEAISEVVNKIVGMQGEEDTLWNRAPEGTPLLHLAPNNHSASVEIEMGQKLMQLIQEHKPSVVVEVGTNRGFSTTWLLLGLESIQQGSLVTFDPDPVLEYWEPFYKQFQIPTNRLTFVQKTTWDAGDALPKEIDFIFHDASHDVEPTIKELELLTPRVRRGGVITFHDTQLCRHMGEVVEKWFQDRVSEWDYSDWNHGRGLGIAVRK